MRGPFVALLLACVFTAGCHGSDDLLCREDEEKIGSECVWKDPLRWLNRDATRYNLWVDGDHAEGNVPELRVRNWTGVVVTPLASGRGEIGAALTIAPMDGGRHVIGVGRGGWNVGLVLHGSALQPVQARVHWADGNKTADGRLCGGTARLELDEWPARWRGITIDALVGTRGHHFSWPGGDAAAGHEEDPIHLTLNRSADPGTTPSLRVQADTCESDAFRLAVSVSEGFSNATFHVMAADGTLTRLPGQLFYNQTRDLTENVRSGFVLDIPGGAAGTIDAEGWGFRAAAEINDLARLSVQMGTAHPWLRLGAGFMVPPPTPPDPPAPTPLPPVPPLPPGPSAGHGEEGSGLRLALAFHDEPLLSGEIEELGDEVRFALGPFDVGIRYSDDDASACQEFADQRAKLCASHPGEHYRGPSAALPPPDP